MATTAPLESNKVAIREDIAAQMVDVDGVPHMPCPSMTPAGRHKNAASLWSQLSQEYWFCEIGSIGISLAAICSILTILLVCDQKPVPAWRYGVTVRFHWFQSYYNSQMDIYLSICFTVERSHIFPRNSSEGFHDYGCRNHYRSKQMALVP